MQVRGSARLDVRGLYGEIKRLLVPYLLENYFLGRGCPITEGVLVEVGLGSFPGEILWALWFYGVILPYSSEGSPCSPRISPLRWSIRLHAESLQFASYHIFITLVIHRGHSPLVPQCTLRWPVLFSASSTPINLHIYSLLITQLIYIQNANKQSHTDSPFLVSFIFSRYSSSFFNESMA